VAAEAEEQALQASNAWVVEQGLPAGGYPDELLDPRSGEPLAVLDLAWPNGVQEGYSQAVALLLDEAREVEEIANRAGYLYFTNIDAFHDYVRHEILALAGTAA
jgi:hypothetical protein